LVDYDHFVLKRGTSGEVFARPAAARGETLFECLERHEIEIPSTCGGSAACGRCWVVVEDDPLPAMLADEARLVRKHGERARLACRLRIPAGMSRLVVRGEHW